MNILFVTWDGPQVSYLETLFLPIFQSLGNDGIRFHVLQFTWGDAGAVDRSRGVCERAGIPYESVRVLRTPRALGAFITAVLGKRQVRSQIRRHGIHVVMPRSVLPALACMLALRGSGVAMVFDADGLPLDERIDFAGESPFALRHRIQRDIEAQAVCRAKLVLARSLAGAEILRARAGAGCAADKFHVVGNGRDPELFHPGSATERSRMRDALGVDADAPLLVYAGSLGPQYCVQEMLSLLARMRNSRPDTRLLVLSRSADYMHGEIERAGIPPHLVISRAVSAEEVPRYLGCADVGLAIRRPSFSMQAVAPIKLGEYLMCGLPVVATAGIGDTDALEGGCGYLLRAIDEDELDAAANWCIREVLPRRETLREECVTTGMAGYSLASSVASYRRALARLGNHP